MDSECDITECLKGLENEGLYAIKVSQEGIVLERLTCQSPNCCVKPHNICINTQGVHINHNITPDRGLKKPVLQYVNENPSKPQQQLLQDLKR